MSNHTLRIGQISYLNVLPLYHHLKRIFPATEDIEYISGHPSEMNALLAQGALDAAPASAFEYLRDAERYRLLPDLSITASHGPVKSVLLVSPVPLCDLPAWMKTHGNAISVTSATASSMALLKVLWKYFWKLPEADWCDIEPGTGLEYGRPFLEIGNFALRNYLNPPQGWQLIDLADEWKRHTNLPFVFAVWIVRRGLNEAQRELLADVHAALMHCKASCHESLDEIAELPGIKNWIDRDGVESYLSTLGYDLGPQEMASLALFGDYCTKLGLIQGMPGLSWAL
ncbi:MAG: menaquinone biosynthesis protein [Proteobacteria bacterium]|nr:menaquinone biosynthesis protein [Pseudomonadota bacterium]